MQEYEQHLIGLGVKTGNQQSARFHPSGNTRKRLGAEEGEHTNKGTIIRSKYPFLKIWYHNSFTLNSREAEVVAAIGVWEHAEASARTQEVLKTNNNHLNNGTFLFPLPLNPGQLSLTCSGHTLDSNKPLTPPMEQPLNIKSFQERHKTLNIQLLPERLKTLSVPTPTEEVKTLSQVLYLL